MGIRSIILVAAKWDSLVWSMLLQGTWIWCTHWWYPCTNQVLSLAFHIPFHSMGCLDVRGTRRSVQLASMDSSSSSETIRVFVRKYHHVEPCLNNFLALSRSLV